MFLMIEVVLARFAMQKLTNLGLIGRIYSGKTTYLTTLHDQLMHSAPEWGVEVSDRAFEMLIHDYQSLRNYGLEIPKTQLGINYFLMRVIWQKRKLDILLWDAGGEQYDRFVECPFADPVLMSLLLQCKSIMVSILCQRILGNVEGQNSQEEDEFLGRFFRELLKSKNRLRQVIALLVGVDVYGTIPEYANQEALQAFDCAYRIFPGVLKNAGISIYSVPLSNIGFGNAFDPKTRRLSRPPKPYNILEPLQLIYPVYLSLWKRMLLKFIKTGKVKTKSDNFNFEKEKQETAQIRGKEKRIINDSETNTEDQISPVIKILFLAANPADTTRLRLDEEIRSIDQALRLSEFRSMFDIKQHWAVRVIDIQGYLLRHKADIVHFSGHGDESNAIILENSEGQSQAVSVRALKQLFYILKDNIRCVVLNACYSEQQAQAIAEHIDCVIGMSNSIGDSAAISFVTAFYQALGYGKDIKTAFDLGCVQIDLENLGEQNTPKLIAKKSNPENIVLLLTNE